MPSLKARSFAFAIVTSLVVASCGGEKENKDSTEVDQPPPSNGGSEGDGPSTSPDDQKPPRSGVASGLRDLQFNMQIPAMINPGQETVQAVLDQYGCGSCHGSGSWLVLDSYPWKMEDSSNQEEIAKAILGVITTDDPETKMPPGPDSVTKSDADMFQTWVDLNLPQDPTKIVRIECELGINNKSRKFDMKVDGPEAIWKVKDVKDSGSYSLEIRYHLNDGSVVKSVSHKGQYTVKDKIIPIEY